MANAPFFMQSQQNPGVDDEYERQQSLKARMLAQQQALQGRMGQLTAEEQAESQRQRQMGEQHLGGLESRQAALTKRPSLKQTVAQLAPTAISTALGAGFEGAEGAASALQGGASEMENERTYRRSLLDKLNMQIETEKGRQETEQFQAGQIGRQAEKQSLLQQMRDLQSTENLGATLGQRDYTTDTRLKGLEERLGGMAPTTKVTQQPDGKPHVMGWNAQTQQFDRDMGEAPPTYASTMPRTRTVTIFGKDGLPTVMSFNPQTGKYDQPVGTSASGAFGSRAAGAGASIRAGENVIADLMQHKDDLGTLGAWVSKAGLNTPIADPELAGIQAELASFAALQPVIHGFRGTNALDTFMKIIGGVQQNPEATIAAIYSILRTAGTINPGGPQPTPPPIASTQPGGGLQVTRDPNGRIVGVQ